MCIICPLKEKGNGPSMPFASSQMTASGCIFLPQGESFIESPSSTFTGLGILLEPLVTVHRTFKKEQAVPVSVP